MPLHKKIFLLLILLLPVQLGYHLWPSWTLVLGRKIDYLSPTIYLTDMFIWALLWFWVWEKKTYLRKRINFKANKYVFIGIVGFILLNCFFASNPVVSILSWSKVFFLSLFVAYVAVEKIKTKDIFRPLVLGLASVSLIGILQFVMQKSIGGPLWFLGERLFDVETPGIARIVLCLFPADSCQTFLRAYSTFPHPNVLGGFIAIVLPIITMEGFSRIRAWPPYQRMLFYCVIFLAMGALLFSFSHSAWVVFLGATIWHIYTQRYKQNMKRIKKLPLILLTVIGMCLLFTIVPIDAESATERMVLFEQGVRLWFLSPLFGVGLGNFMSTLPQVIEQGTLFILQPVHNIYVLFLAELGLIPVVAFIIFFRRLFVWVDFHRVEVLALVSALALGMVDHYLLTVQQGLLLFALVLGLTLGTKSNKIKYS